MTGGVGHSLRDADIRGPLAEWLLSRHAGDPKAALIHEFKMPRPSARVDIAFINGQMEAYEIKSDVDSFTRLSRQIGAFACIFDHVSVVTTSKRAAAVERAVPAWCAVIVMRLKHGRPYFATSQRGRKLTNLDNAGLLHALNRKELLRILSLVDAVKGCATCPKQALVDKILLKSFDVREAVRQVLRERSEALPAAL